LIFRRLRAIDPWGNLINRGAVTAKTNHEPLNSAPAPGTNQLNGYNYDADRVSLFPDKALLKKVRQYITLAELTGVTALVTLGALAVSYSWCF
jgi:hypothetical protein